MTLLSKEDNGNSSSRYDVRLTDPPRLTHEIATIENDASSRHPAGEIASTVALQSLPAWLNATLQKMGPDRSVTALRSCYSGRLGRRLEENEDDFHRILGKALEVAERHPVLRVKLPAQPPEVKHIACLLIGELIITGRLEGFEEGYDRSVR